jgi:hypothetical protein
VRDFKWLLKSESELEYLERKEHLFSQDKAAHSPWEEEHAQAYFDKNLILSAKMKRAHSSSLKLVSKIQNSELQKMQLKATMVSSRERKIIKCNPFLTTC